MQSYGINLFFFLVGSQGLQQLLLHIHRDSPKDKDCFFNGFSFIAVCLKSVVQFFVCLFVCLFVCFCVCVVYSFPLIDTRSFSSK